MSCLVAAAATNPAAAAIHLAVAIGAIYRLVTAWYEGYFGVFAAVSAYNLGHRALGATIAASTATAAVATAAVAAATAVAAISAAVVACSFLGCAAIRAASWLAVALLVVKVLLTLCKGESSTAIAAR